MQATTVTLNVLVVNTTGVAGQLRGWIDFNRVGGFAAAEGRCVAVGGATPPGGTATLTWNGIAGTLVSGQSYLRLRLSIDPAMSTSTPAGALIDGEVEDHPVTISALTAVSLVSFNAYQLGDSVFVEWKTGFEADNLGFNLYREVGGKRYQVTSSLLAGFFMRTLASSGETECDILSR